MEEGRKGRLRGGVERRGSEERERDKRDCSIKRNVNPAHTHCEYPRYLQWVGCPFASAAGVEPFHWAAPSLPLFVHASPSLSLSPSPPLSRVFRFPSRPFPSTTVITAFFKADDFQLSGDQSGFEGSKESKGIENYIIRNWGGIWTFINARITWNLNPSTNKIGSD